MRHDFDADIDDAEVYIRSAIPRFITAFNAGHVLHGRCRRPRAERADCTWPFATHFAG